LVERVKKTENKLISTNYLENGLTISFYDESRKIAGDRWQITLKASIKILTNQVQFTRMDPEKRSEIIQEVGDLIYYEKKLIRNFVGEKQKEETVTALYESFLQITRPYFSHSQFAERFILKKYADSLKNVNG
jgi:hypothetical protein